MTGRQIPSYTYMQHFRRPINFVTKNDRKVHVFYRLRTRHARQKNHNRAQEEPSAASKSMMRTMCRLPTILAACIAHRVKSTAPEKKRKICFIYIYYIYGKSEKMKKHVVNAIKLENNVHSCIVTIRNWFKRLMILWQSCFLRVYAR